MYLSLWCVCEGTVWCALFDACQSGQSALRGVCACVRVCVCACACVWCVYMRAQVCHRVWAYFASGSEGDRGKGFSSVGKNVPLCSNYRCSQCVWQPSTRFRRWRENGGGLGETVWGKETVFILSLFSWELCLWAGHIGVVLSRRSGCSSPHRSV